LEIPDVIVKVHPPTAGVGVLLIDGGGARGVVPPAILQIIQDKIGLPIPVQNFFKVAFGTSAGKYLSVMGASMLISLRRFDHSCDVH
jgi:patatin-like phospholipase/acyl hydrolase